MKPNRFQRLSKPFYTVRALVLGLIGATLFLALGCETKSESPTSNAPVSIARSKLDPDSSLVELLGNSEIRPISETSFWRPFLRDGFNVKTGKRFGDGDYGPTGSFWIRLCWSRSAQYGRMIDGRRLPPTPGSAKAMRWIQEAVGATWMHYANIDFFHWNGMGDWYFCTDEGETNRIVIGFSDTNFADQGRFDDAPTRILFDGTMTKREDYMRAAYNLFGRALNVLPSTTEASAPMTPEGVYAAQIAYGLRRSGSLIEWRGYCVRDTVNSGTSSTGNIEPIDCNLANDDRIWRPIRPAGNSTTLLATYASNRSVMRCIQRFPESPGLLITGGCDNANPVDFKNVKWKATGNLCVTVSGTREGAFLHLQTCDATTTVSRWNFEFLDPKRISLSGTETCLTVAPTELVSGSPLTLAACDKVAPRLTFSDKAQLGFGDGLYAALEEDQPTVGTKLILMNAAHIGNASKFYVSGRITSSKRCATTPVRPLANLDWRVESSDCSLPTVLASVPELDPLEWDYHW